MTPMIEVMNLTEAEAYDPGPEDVCISITSPTVEADLQGGWQDVLRLQFHDTDLDRGDVEVFTEDMARALLIFIMRQPTIDRIIVHCEAGMSRSPAVGLALHEILTGEPPHPLIEEIYPCYNSLVRTRLLEVWEGFND